MSRARKRTDNVMEVIHFVALADNTPMANWGGHDNAAHNEEIGAEEIGDEEEVARNMERVNLLEPEGRRPNQNQARICHGRHYGSDGAMFQKCAYCGALKLKPLQGMVDSPGELKWWSMCCNKGNIFVDSETPSPRAQDILELWDENSNEGAFLRKFSRKLNSAFALASFVGETVQINDGSNYSPSYVVRGTPYMLLGALYPPERCPPKFAQIYIHDPQFDRPGETQGIRQRHMILPRLTARENLLSSPLNSRSCCMK
ncbi:MAG: hypothetical protein ACREOZ_04990 [Gloeomargaritales cyanobacterium]